MEVLPVQNQFQGQFGVIRSTKIKDWTAPLTLPLSSHNNGKNSNTEHHHYHHHNSDIDTTDNIGTEIVSSSTILAENDSSINALSLRLQSELRAAKSCHLACTEVLLPADLLHRVASEIIKVSEKEPCGIRGCSIFIEFEDEPQSSNARRIATLKIDPNTISTFELYLTLKHDRSGWTSILPQFLKNLTRSSTIMISPEFNLTKNKLYNTFSE